MKGELPIAALFFGLTLSALAGDSGTNPIKGTVRDALGNPIPNVVLVFEAARGSGARAHFWINTGSDGSFFAELPAGGVLVGIAPDCFDIVRLTWTPQAYDLTLRPFAEEPAYAYRRPTGAVSSLTSSAPASFTAPSRAPQFDTTDGFRLITKTNPAASVPSPPSDGWTGSYYGSAYSSGSRYWNGTALSSFSANSSSYSTGWNFGTMNKLNWNSYGFSNAAFNSGLLGTSVSYSNSLVFNSGLWSAYYPSSSTWSSAYGKYNYSNFSNLNLNSSHWSSYSYKNYWTTYEWNRRYGLPPKGIRVHADAGCARWVNPNRDPSR